MLDLVLIHTPVALPCEPPLGLGILAGQLRGHGVEVQVIDANVEALHSLLYSVEAKEGLSTAERRSIRRRDLVLDQLKSWRGYDSLDRYRGALADLNLLLKQAAAKRSPEVRLGLADYHDQRSPFWSRDLLQAAQHAQHSPFFPYFSDLVTRVEQAGPRVVGLSINYLHQVLPALALAGVFHQRLPQLPLVLGGALMECWQGRLSSSALSPYVDRISFASGVDLLLEELGQTAGFLAAKIGLPDYAEMPWQRYLTPMRIAPFSTSIGCVWGRCNYCPEAVSPTTFSGIEAEKVPHLLDQMVSQTGAELLHLTDNAIPPATLLALADQGCSSNWYGFVRFYPQLADAQHCQALKRSGCAMLQIGLETGSPSMLKRLHKGISLDLASRSLHTLHQAGISVYLYVMFGIPGESEADAQMTLNFIAEHAPTIRYINTSLLNYPVQSPLDPDLQFKPYDPDRSDLNLYMDFRQANGWDRRSVRSFLEKQYAKDYRIAPILRRTPTTFGANHAPLFELVADH